MLNFFSPIGFDLIFTTDTRFWIRIYRILRIIAYFLGLKILFILDVFFRIKQWHNLAILALIFLMNPGFLDNLIFLRRVTIFYKTDNRTYLIDDLKQIIHVDFTLHKTRVALHVFNAMSTNHSQK